MNKLKCKPSELWVSAAGLAALIAVFLWWRHDTNVSIPAMVSALASAGLFAVVCLRFVPDWMLFWRKAERKDAPHEAMNPEPRRIELKIFFSLLIIDVVILLLVYCLRVLSGHHGSFRDYLEFWRCLDSGQYLDIAREWYLSEGEWDRLVRLVFLPGYPLVVQLFNYVIGYDLYAGLTVSALCFAGAGCVLYRLLRLDFSHSDALRTLRYLCIFPGVFFFAAPMSEGLFLLLCASCLYSARTGRWTWGCFFGGLAAFTRSVGLTLCVPLFFELIWGTVQAWDGMETGQRIKYLAMRALSLLLVPAGFAAYCRINYLVSGDPFKFLEYQSVHWHQHLGWFFNTAAYQTEYAISTFSENPHSFWGLWLPNLIAGFGSLALMIAAEKKLRASFVAWFIAYYVIAMGATWLLSAPRYMMALIPVPMAAAVVTERKAADIAGTALCGALSLIYMAFFAMRWQVW